MADRLQPVRALLFDMDGTLIDTELHTEQAVGLVAAQHGVADYSLPHTETRGRTWLHVAETLRAQTGIAAAADVLAAAMLAHWNAMVAQARTIPGAPQAIRAAAARGLKIAIVSSSPRSVIDYFADRLGIADCIGPRQRIGADSVQVGKPDPEGFLLAARVLEVTPEQALVFEDSRAGLLAARAAGMRAMFITCCAAEIPENSKLATATMTDYEKLPPQLWDELLSGIPDLAGRVFT